MVVANGPAVTDAQDANGTVGVILPVEVGGPEDVPPLACYMQDPTSGAWWIVSDGWSVDAPWCATSFEAGRWSAIMFNVPAGWLAAFVVAY